MTLRHLLTRPSTLSATLLLLASTASAAHRVIDVSRPGAEINPAMWGVFFEDINFGADGGLSAELVKNGRFQFPDALAGWQIPAGKSSSTSLELGNEEQEGVKYPFLKIAANSVLENEGFRGMGITKDEVYTLTLEARSPAGARVEAELVIPGGASGGSASLSLSSSAWTKVTLPLTATRTELRAKLRLSIRDAAIEIRSVSLLPVNVWKGKAPNLRADMVQTLADLGPGFLRFPGGCIVEGAVLDLRYQWKKTIGPLEKRPLLLNRWNVEFKHRATSDYYQSFHLGFYEYFLLCEDLKAEPLPILNCGMACQYNSGELAPLDQMEPYIQDTLDLIEFANGAPDTPWGARRVALGHPAPFNLKTLGVGNEQWGPQYVERFEKVQKAVKAVYPNLQLVAAAGPSPSGERFDLAWKRFTELGADIIDEHNYDKPDWFFDNAYRYDHYSRTGPKVFMGEYAAQSDAPGSGILRNTLRCALSEAAFMTGMERNADVVRMASYAPLFSHYDAWQWAPDLIWTDNLRVVPTPSYHVQRLFARNRGDAVLPVASRELSEAEKNRTYSSAVLDRKTGEVIVKLVNATAAEITETLEFSGVVKLGTKRITRLHAEDPLSVNTFDAPALVTPKEETLAPTEGNRLTLTLRANTFAVVRIQVAK